MPKESKIHDKFTISPLSIIAFGGLFLTMALGLAHANPQNGVRPETLETRQIMINAHQDALKGYLNLSATASVSSAPDMASISFAVTNKAKTAKEAMAANAKRMNAVFTALKALGIPEKQIMTNSVNLNPNYVYQENQAPRIDGYNAHNQISVKTYDINQLGAMIDTVTASGINQIDSIQFGIRDQNKAMDEARLKAVAMLMARAEAYTKATGHKSFELISLSENFAPAYNPNPMPMMVMAKAEAAPTPISAGEMETSLSLSASFQMKK